MLCNIISSPSLQLGHLSSLSVYLKDVDIVRTFMTCKFIYYKEYPKLSLTQHYSVKKIQNENRIIPKISNYIFDAYQDYSKYKSAKSIIVYVHIIKQVCETLQLDKLMLLVLPFLLKL